MDVKYLEMFPRRRALNRCADRMDEGKVVKVARDAIVLVTRPVAKIIIFVCKKKQAYKE